MINIKQSAIIMLFITVSLTTMFDPNGFSIAVSPVILTMFIIYAYRNDVSKFNFNEFILSKDSPTQVWNALMFAVISQGLINTVTQVLLHHPTANITNLQYPIIPITAVLLAPIYEEVLYRKIIFKFIESKTNFWIGGIISSLLFAASHLNYIYFLGYFVVGMIWCHFYKKYNNLAVTITAHMINNFAVYLFATIKMG